MNYIIKDILMLVDEKYQEICELLILTKEQTELLKNEDIEGLGRYIGYKQHIIDRVNMLDIRFAEMNAQLKEEYNVKSLEGISDNNMVKKILDLNLKTNEAVSTMLEIENMNISMGKKLMGEQYCFSGRAILDRVPPNPFVTEYTYGNR